MIDLKPTIKKYGALIVVGVVLLIGVQIWKNRPIFDRADVLYGQVTQMKLSSVKTAKEILAHIASDEKFFKAQQEAIAILKGSEAAKVAAIAVGNKRIDVLQAQYATLLDCPSQLTNMTGQRDEFKKNFMESQALVVDMGSEIYALGVQQDLTSVARDGYKNLWTDEKDLRVKGEESYNALVKEVKTMRFWSSTKTVFGIGAAAAVVYLLLKK